MQTRNWKLKTNGKIGEAMFAVAFCIAGNFRIAELHTEKGAPSWKYVVDNFILKNLKLYFEHGDKGEVINFL